MREQNGGLMTGQTSHDTSGFSDRLLSTFMPLLPKDDMSYWVGRLMHQKLPKPLRLQSMRAFAKAYNLNLDEAEKSIEEYESIGDLFTRKLKPGVRPIAEGMVHPCDSKIAEAGPVRHGKIPQVKGIDYTVEGLLRNHEVAERFKEGAFVTYYLCPTDYHRVHLPLDGRVEWISHIPGAFWPVNNWSVRNVSQLYAINERVAMMFRTPEGYSFALVMVAATNVGSIKLAFDSSFDTEKRPRGRKTSEKWFGENEITLKKGDEAGLFSMGSSVVMLMDPELSKRHTSDTKTLVGLHGHFVKMGQTLV
ncbi:MAG: archaetidylserine decarboxylase [Bdellovibrionales bacterium]|jgi:phosphatidylserine decarboxylase|nr:archaetidylserine decarboxylase [Bdellovibrionales bacterium]